MRGQRRCGKLNRGQGEIYIWRGGEIGLGAVSQLCCASLKGGPAAPLDPLASVGQIGEKVAHPFPHCGTGPRHRLAVASWRTQPQMGRLVNNRGVEVTVQTW